MTGLSLFLVFVLAKAFSLWGHVAHVTLWSSIAWFWQDALAAVAYAAIGQVTRGSWKYPWRAFYWLLVAWAAINIPVARAVFTPLTPPMLRAAGGPLADSIRLYITPANVALMFTVILSAFLLPQLLQRLPSTAPKWAAVSAVAMIAAGPTASARANTHGMDRNVLFAVAVRNSVPNATDLSTLAGGRMLPYPATATEDLRPFSASARGFNVVMVGLESTAARYLNLFDPAANRDHADAMPNLTALARNGLVFENAYAVYPESIKGLFSVLCSMYPAFNTEPAQYTGSGCQPIASALAKAGYRTALFHSGRFDYLGMESIIHQSGYGTLEDAGDIGGNHESSFGVDEPATVTRILSWIDTLPAGQRFFLTYLPIAGHHPYATPSAGPFAVRDEIDQYRNALYYGDVSLGALVKGLRDRGLSRNTLWIVYGDHGEAFHQHEGNYGHTFFLYEENVHVPLIVAAPGIIEVRHPIEKVVSLVDVGPTILDLAGLPSPANYQGRTVLDPAPRRAYFFTDYSLGLLGLRDGPWKFISETGSSRAELYDLKSDPGETVNLAIRRSGRVTEYDHLARRWSAAQRAAILRAGR